MCYNKKYEWRFFYMKKIVLYILLLFFTSSFTFAISDITLHMDGDDIVIRKNKIYVENEKIGVS